MKSEKLDNFRLTVLVIGTILSLTETNNVDVKRAFKMISKDQRLVIATSAPSKMLL